jgi:Domain of unknown function (DUF397)
MQDSVEEVVPGPDLELAGVSWHKSSASGNASCVEMAYLPTSGIVALRGARNRLGKPLFFTRQEWDAFLAGARKGEFDLPPDLTSWSRRGFFAPHVPRRVASAASAPQSSPARVCSLGGGAGTRYEQLILEEKWQLTCPWR